MAIESRPAEAGKIMPAFELPRVDGAGRLGSKDLAGHPVVVMFICNHCPYVKAIEDRLVALAREHEGSGVRFVAIGSNDVESYPDDAPAALAERARQKGYGFPYLHDASQDVARAFGAVCTPDFFVYDADHELTYRGRLDDSWKDAAAVTRRDLSLAIEAARGGRAFEGPQRPSLGCSIKWRES